MHPRTDEPQEKKREKIARRFALWGMMISLAAACIQLYLSDAIQNRYMDWKDALPPLRSADMYFSNEGRIGPEVEESPEHFEVLPIPHSQKVMVKQNLHPKYHEPLEEQRNGYTNTGRLTRYAVIDVESGEVEMKVDLPVYYGETRSLERNFEYRTVFYEEGSVNIVFTRTLYRVRQPLSALFPSWKITKNGFDHWLVRSNGEAVQWAKKDLLIHGAESYGDRVLSIHGKGYGKEYTLTENQLAHGSYSKTAAWEIDGFPGFISRITDSLLVSHRRLSRVGLDSLYVFVKGDPDYVRVFDREEVGEFIRFYLSPSAEFERDYFLVEPQKQTRFRQNSGAAFSAYQSDVRNARLAERVEIGAATDPIHEEIQRRDRENLKRFPVSHIRFVPLTRYEDRPAYVFLNIPGYPVFRVHEENLESGSLYDIFEWIGSCENYRPLAMVNGGKNIVLHWIARLDFYGIDQFDFGADVQEHLFLLDVVEGKRLEAFRPFAFSDHLRFAEKNVSHTV